MIPKSRVVNTESNIQVATTTMEFSKDEVAMGLIINQLIDGIASDKIAYPMREYFANAWDANRNVPFNVQLPTQLEPSFMVRDFGPGLTHQFMTTSFMRLGDSTKRTSNAAIGSKGLGCKSAFAYTDAFTVRSFQGGTVNVYSIARKENRVPGLTHLGSFPTDEQDGLEITIPVRPADIGSFHAMARHQLAGFLPKPNVLNKNFNGIYDIEDCISSPDKSWRLMKTKNGIGRPYVKMGPMLYPFDPLKINTQGSRYSYYVYSEDIAYILEVPIGAIDVTASREDIQYSDDTIKVLQASLDAYQMELNDLITKTINSVPTYFEACISMAKLKGKPTQANNSELAISRAAKHNRSIFVHKASGKTIDGNYAIKDAAICILSRNSKRMKPSTVKSRNADDFITVSSSLVENTFFYVVTNKESHNWYKRVKSHWPDDRDSIFVIHLGDMQLPDDFKPTNLIFAKDINVETMRSKKLKGTSKFKLTPYQEKFSLSKVKFDILDANAIVDPIVFVRYLEKGVFNTCSDRELRIGEHMIDSLMKYLHGKSLCVLTPDQDYILASHPKKFQWFGEALLELNPDLVSTNEREEQLDRSRLLNDTWFEFVKNTTIQDLNNTKDIFSKIKHVFNHSYDSEMINKVAGKQQDGLPSYVRPKIIQDAVDERERLITKYPKFTKYLNVHGYISTRNVRDYANELFNEWANT